MLFHRSGEVAIQAALLLAFDARPVPRRSRELAARLGIPTAYLAKVLHELARAGVLLSARGPGGGFQLARPPTEICLWHVLAAVEPLGRFDACLLGLGACEHGNPCPLHNDWILIRDQFVAFLRAKTLAEIALEAQRKNCCRLAPDAQALSPLHPRFIGEFPE